MATNTIVLPTNFTPDMLAQANAFLTGLGTFPIVVAGILLTLLVVEVLINMFRK